MGFTAELHWEIFAEPGPESVFCREEERKYLEEEKELETLFWEVECTARPIDLKEKESLVREKCARVAQSE